MNELISIKKGSDISIITYGLGVIWAKKYVDNCNYDVEIIDLRTLLPLDLDCILKSVSKTNKVLILHEDNITGGIGGEISSLISENIFEYLDAPIMRLGSLDTPVPFSKNIENDIYFPVKRIAEKVNKLMKY